MVTQAAAVLGLLAWGRGAVPVAAAIALSALLLTCTWVRMRRRWLYQWLGLWLRYAARRRTLDAGASAGDLLRWLHPDARLTTQECDGTPAGVIEDGYGRTALLELGDPGELLVGAATAPVPLHTLLPAGGDGAPVHLRLVVTGSPAPALRAGGGAAATSYRQLADGRPLAAQRAVLGVRVDRTEATTDEDLTRALATAVRRVRRRIGTARVLAEPAVPAVLADLAHHDPEQPGRERWPGVRLGGLVQATYRVRRLPDPAEASSAHLVPRMLALPAASTTVALAVDANGASMAVRLAAPDAAALAVAAQALRRLLGGFHAAAQRMDGEHAPGLVATLPIANVHSGRVVPAADAGILTPPVGGAGLVLGRDRHGDTVVARLFRAEPTRALLAGGLPAAQLVTLRALALGARVVVQSARPQAWESFVRGVSAPGDAVILAPLGRPAAVLATPGSPLVPQLVVVDAGAPVAAELPAGWRTTLLVREELHPGDLDALARADLVVLQPLSPPEAALAAGALGLGAAQDWLSRIRGDMIGVVNRRTVRWAQLAATQVEQQLLGAVGRG